MNNRKNQNSILVLATLGVYLGLVLAGATLQVRAQEKSNNEITVNNKPLAEFAKKANTKEVDLNAPFSVEYEVLFPDKGKPTSVNFSIVKSDGNPNLNELVKNAIDAIGESGYFQYFHDLGIDKSLIKGVTG